MLRLSPEEPPHVDVVSRHGSAKVWLRPVTLEYATGLSHADQNRLLELVADRQMELLHAWASLRAATGAGSRLGRRN